MYTIEQTICSIVRRRNISFKFISQTMKTLSTAHIPSFSDTANSKFGLIKLLFVKSGHKNRTFC